MDFYEVLPNIDFGRAPNPYAAQNTKTGEWIAGEISVDFLNEHYGSKYDNIDDMIENATSEGHRLYFEWLKEEGILN